MIRDPWLRALVVVVCAIATIYLVGMVWQVLQQFADIVLLFFLAWLLAFILEPVVGRLTQDGRVPRGAAIGITYVALAVVLSLGVVLLVPALAQQVAQVAGDLPRFAEQVAGWVAWAQATTNAWLAERGSPILVDLRSALNAQELTRGLQALGPGLLGNALSFAAGAATVLVELLLVVILSVYFMVDGGRMAESLLRTLPPRAQDDARFLIASIHRAFAGFMRGQVIQALVSGIGTGVLMAVLRVDYALLAGVVAGVVLLIPFLGPVLALWVPVTIALFTTRVEVALILGGLLLLLQQVIFNVVAPRVMSSQVGLHPLLVFFAVLAGARVAGVWGALFGVPVVAVLATMASFYRASQEERAARLQEHLPGQELLSVPSAPTPSAPATAAAGVEG